MMDNSATKYEQCAQEDIFEPANIKVKKKSNAFLYFAVISVGLLPFGLGTAYSWTSPVLPKLKSEDPSVNPLGYRISASQESLVSSFISLGALVGPFIASQTADRLGRKKTLLLITAPMIVAYLTLAFAKTVHLYYISRFLLGVGEGCILSVIPMYVGEIAKNTNRALLLGSFTELFITAGELVSVILGLFFGIQVMCLVLTIPFVVFVVIFYFFVPESPYYNLIVNKEVKAEINLKRLRRTSDVKEELQEIGDYVKESMQMDRSFWDLFKSKLLIRAVLISVGLMFCQEMSGMVIITYYSEEIFSASTSQIPSNISPIIACSVKLISTLIASTFVEKFGRRILLLTSLTGMTLSLALLGLYFHLKPHLSDNNIYTFSPLICVIFYIIFFTVGAGPLPWTMIGELFPPDVKAVAAPVPIFSNNVYSYISSFAFPYFLEYGGMAVTVWFFGGVCVVALVFVAVWVPETRGRSLQEIQQDLGGTT